MSATIPTPVDVVAVREPVTNVMARPKYGVIEGPETVSWQIYPASSVSAGNITISANQPNRGTLVDRRVWLQVNASFAITGTVPGGLVPLLNIGVSDAFRAFPLMSVTSSMTMKIGGKAVTVGSMDQMWPYMLRYHNPIVQRDTDYSVTPAMMDQFQEYSQGLATNRNPLAGYGANPAEMTRGGWTQALITSLVNPAPAAPATVTSTFNVTFQEPLLLSPFLFARGDNEPALIGVDTFNFTATFDALSRMWSRFNVAGGSSVSPLVAGQGVAVTFNSAALLFRQLTPNPTVAIPRSLAYSYFNPALYQTALGTPVISGAQATLQSSVITLPGIPRRIYIWASEIQANQSYLTSDTMFSVDQVTIKWGTKTYLREATPVDLYNIAVKNGVNLSWPQWRSFTGGILALELGSDIGLAATESAGSDGKYQIQVTLQATNLSTRSITPNINIVAVQEGVIEIRDGAVYVNENPVMARDVLNAREYKGVTYKRSESVYGGGIVGGDFFGDLLSGVKRVAGIASSVLPLASMMVPGLAPAAGIARAAHAALGGRRRGMAAGKRVMGVGGARKAIRARMRGRGFDEGKAESKEEEVDEDEQSASGGEDVYEDEPDGGSLDDEEDDDDAVSAYMAGRR